MSIVVELVEGRFEFIVKFVHIFLFILILVIDFTLNLKPYLLVRLLQLVLLPLFVVDLLLPFE